MQPNIADDPLRRIFPVVGSPGEGLKVLSLNTERPLSLGSAN